jgi:hypothetical protein
MSSLVRLAICQFPGSISFVLVLDPISEKLDRQHLLSRKHHDEDKLGTGWNLRAITFELQQSAKPYTLAIEMYSSGSSSQAWYPPRKPPPGHQSS